MRSYDADVLETGYYDPIRGVSYLWFGSYKSAWGIWVLAAVLVLWLRSGKHYKTGPVIHFLVLGI